MVIKFNRLIQAKACFAITKIMAEVKLSGGVFCQTSGLIATIICPGTENAPYTEVGAISKEWFMLIIIVEGSFLPGGYAVHCVR